MRGVRPVLALMLVTGLAVIVAACGGSSPGVTTVRPSAQPLDPTGDRLFLTTDTGVSAVDGDSGEVLFEADDAVGTPDWSRLYRTAAHGPRTEFVTLDPRDGDIVAGFEIPASGVEVRVVSYDGRLVALAPPHEVTSTGAPIGRERTDLVVASPDGRVMPFSLPGNYEPEAFSLDGTSLVVLEYTPPSAPEQYQVRRLDLTTGAISDIYGPDDEAQRAMSGTARTSAVAPDGRRLYTYYAVESLGTAFVHVQSLDEDWAFCLDLPQPFGLATDAPVALGVSADGATLWAADLATGVVARADTEALAVSEVQRIDPAGDEAVTAMTVDDTRVYVAAGSQVQVLDASSLDIVDTFEFGTSAETVNAGPDGRRLYVGLASGLAVIDREDGTELGHFAMAGVRSIAVAGEAAEPIEPSVPPDGVQCAC